MTAPLRYFLSGASGIRNDVLPRVAAMIPHRLLSMHSAFKGNTKVWTAVSHHPACGMEECMLDSGAFTAFTKGHKVELDDLIATYDDTMRKLNPKIQVWLINLDVIPGSFGAVATPTQVDEALDRSDKNFKVLKKRYGARVLPVFHQTEPNSRLKAVVDMNDFVAMGFRQDFAEEHRIRCAEESLEYAHSKGVLVHGLATTGYKMLSRAPFDTVDSATWLYIAAMGGISYVSEQGTLDSIAVSQESPQQRTLRAHYRTLPHEEQAFILKRITEAGTNLTEVESDLSYRILFNAHQMREWLKNFKRPTIRREQGLFS